MPAAQNLTELAAKMRMTEKEALSAFFHVTDFISDLELSDNVINCGAYYNSPLNGDDNMVKSCKEIIFAIYQELEGQVPKPAGPWFHINQNGIKFNDQRHMSMEFYMGIEE